MKRVQLNHQPLKSIFKKPQQRTMVTISHETPMMVNCTEMSERRTNHSHHIDQSSSLTAFHSKSFQRTDISSGVRSGTFGHFWDLQGYTKNLEEQTAIDPAL